MVFSEPTFIFLFLPSVLILYYITPLTIKNTTLLLASWVFYAWGEDLFILVLLGSITINYFFGRLIDASVGSNRKCLLGFGIAANIALLGYFKYLGFFLENLGLNDLASRVPPLPIGISFFTFQALSYLIDLSSHRITVQRDPFKLALFISMFPQLIAGPIVRYSEVEKAITDRKTTRDDYTFGMQRFIIGLAKKTLIADPLGLIADQVFNIPITGLSPAVAWLGAIAYTLQLYFDFSAYSDMAIGLGRIFGFRFPENFNYPYISRSITEFWRRWHMTLSRWFRDYVYIPLGGNRLGSTRTYFNLFVVFLLTGFWHGAAWNFVFWGGYHGIFLMFERLGLNRLLDRTPAFLSHSYLLLVIILGWVLFRAEGVEQSLGFYGAMLMGKTGETAVYYPLVRYLDSYVMLILVAGVIFATPVYPVLRNILKTQLTEQALISASTIKFWLLFLSSVISVGSSAYSPFIYFRF